MKLTERYLRQLVSEALTFNRIPLPGRKGTMFDRDAKTFREMRRSDLESNSALPDGHPKKRDEEEINAHWRKELSRFYDLVPDEPYESYYEDDQADIRTAKKIFDKGSEVAKTGHRVRCLRGKLSQEILYWSKRDEVSCKVFKTTPVNPVCPVAVLLRGGVVTFADFEDLQSHSRFTPSGRRRYPSIDISDRVGPDGKINVSWEDVERRRIERDEEWGNPPPAVTEAEEALVTGSFPEAVIVSEFVDDNESGSIEEILADLELVDLPLVDVYLRPISLEQAERILRGE
jgi:hypothetical protein